MYRSQVFKIIQHGIAKIIHKYAFLLQVLPKRHTFTLIYNLCIHSVEEYNQRSDQRSDSVLGKFSQIFLRCNVQESATPRTPLSTP